MTAFSGRIERTYVFKGGILLPRPVLSNMVATSLLWLLKWE